ncbi:MAG: hypothetical protein JWO19_3204 [Bryobacterales bacterium]|nr:hypothetical protein [Bryobacterales bacterium]
MLQRFVYQIAAVSGVLVLLASSAAAQNSAAAAKAAAPAKPAAPSGPAPRHADGRIDISGLWRPADIFLIEDIALGLRPGETIPLNAWSQEKMKKQLSKDDPEANCLPTGVPRHAPYPWKFVESPPYIYMLFEGNIHSFRQVYMDGRAHPTDPNPTWYGHSTGRWDKDTLVIDTVGFNDKFWFDFVGHPHTEQLHTVERYARPDLGSLAEEVVITDPGAYTKPFTINAKHRLMPGDELLEYICQENQRDTQHLVGPAGRP